MFLAIFWSAFIPIGALILSLIGEWLIQSFQQLRPYAWSDLLEPRPEERWKTRPQANLAALGLSLMLVVPTLPDTSKHSAGPDAADAGAQLAQYCMPSQEDGAPAKRIFG
jgi:hypothetical protein